MNSHSSELVILINVHKRYQETSFRLMDFDIQMRKFLATYNSLGVHKITGLQISQSKRGIKTE